MDCLREFTVFARKRLEMFQQMEDNWALANRQKAWNLGEGKSEGRYCPRRAGFTKRRA